MSEKLSLLDNSSDSEVELKINRSYATSYDVWRNKEELQKYKDLKKEDDDSESSSESEEEVPEFDEEFLRALSLVKGKDPRIYDKDFELFKTKEIVKKPKAAKQTRLFMKDYERNLVLERGGKFSDDEDDDDERVTPKVSAHNEEMENLKSLKEAVGDSDSENDDLLRERTKTKTEEEAEEEDYVKWLKGEEKEISEDVKKDMSYLRNYWNDPTLEEGEQFLRDYILNKRYLEKDESEIPTYEELTSGMLSDDEKMTEEQEKFEHKYNFRFEEPDEEFIKRYPRTVGDSLRKPDNRRKQKREEKFERKRKEKEQRQEELKRLKALKRKEIEEKFMKLKEISGQEKINLNESDIESDFDPDKHDQKMREMFNEDYYQFEEDQKPEFPFDEELDAENWNNWSREKCGGDDDEEEDEKMSDRPIDNVESGEEKLLADPRDKFADEMINASHRKKKAKKKSLFAKVISQTKPVYDPDGKSFEEYLDEYYKLDYEDVVGDMPVRYKYRKVIPNDFGLTVDEILASDDRELNRWCSVKKTCQYRNDDEEMYDVQAFHKKAQNPLAKEKVLLSVYAKKDDDDFVLENEEVKKKHDGMKDSVNGTEENKDFMHSSTNDEVHDGNKDQGFGETCGPKKKKKRKKRNREYSSALGSETGHTSGIVLGNICSPEAETLVQSHENTQNSSEDQMVAELQKKSKKKKHKERQNISGMETESEHNLYSDRFAEINSIAGISQSTEVEDSVYCKSAKRKRVDEQASFLVADSDANIEETGDNNTLLGNFSPESKRKRISHANDTSGENFNSESTPGVVSKKKKKKKKRKGNDMSDKASNDQFNKSNSYRKKFSDEKHKQFVKEDKRLGLSDARLAAYGINPKKFKNKIIYSEN